MLKETALLFCIFRKKNKSNNSFELLTTSTETIELVISYIPFQTTGGVCFHVVYTCATEYKFLIPPEVLIPLCSLSSS